MYSTKDAYSVGQIQRLLNEYNNKAIEAERSGDYGKAEDYYREMAMCYRRLSEFENNLAESARLNKKAIICEEKAKKLSEENRSFEGNETHGQNERGINNFSEIINSLIYRSDVTWDEIGGMEDVKSQLKFAMGLLLSKKPKQLKNFEIPTRILLYGPPGTGKTLLAAASANTLGATFYNVKVSDLLSKYFGESCKLISALFDNARDKADSGLAVIFIDEIESLVMNREVMDSGPEKRIISTILAEIDGLANKSILPNIITIAATNRPWDLDNAFLSRMDLKILVGLPDRNARKQIFDIHLTKRGYELSQNLTLDDLADRTDGLTGRDIQRICKKVIMNVLMSMNKDIPSKIDNRTINEHEINIRPLNWSDFQDFINKIPKRSPDDIEKYRKWHQQNGLI